MAIQTVDLTQRPPRSPRVRLGGYVILPRMLDKGRATINGASTACFSRPLISSVAVVTPNLQVSFSLSVCPYGLLE